jgi:hypothetical protein
MAYANGTSKSSDSKGHMDPTHRVEYTDAKGSNSEAAYSASSAVEKAANATSNGATNVTVKDLKTGR